MVRPIWNFLQASVDLTSRERRDLLFEISRGGNSGWEKRLFRFASYCSGNAFLGLLRLSSENSAPRPRFPINYGVAAGFVAFAVGDFLTRRAIAFPVALPLIVGVSGDQFSTKT